MNEVITLNQNTESVAYLCKKDKRLAKIVSMVGEITYKPHEDSFEFLVGEIIGQMLSNKAARCIQERLYALCNPITPEGILRISDEELRDIGVSYRKIAYIKNLATITNSGLFSFEGLETMSDQEAIKELTSIKGIGEWSAKMYLIFALNRQDILPAEDMAFIQAYKWVYKTEQTDPESVEKRCKKWKPYSSIAARYFYKAHDMGFTKQEFHLFK